MHPSTRLRPVFVTAPDGGLPGIPGSGPTGGGGGLPGIPGGGLSGTPQQPPVPQPAPAGGQPQFAQPTPPVVGEPVTYELASWGRRFGAFLLDGLIMGIVFIPLLLIAGVLGADAGTTTSGDGTVHFSSNNGEVLVLFLLWLVVILLYAPATMASMQGSTPGKRMLGIRVVRADGGPVTFGFAVKRELLFKGIVLGIANFVTFGLAWLVNYLWPLWDAENRALHDMAAKSRVVRR